jgi:hypothetical protein
MGVGDVLEEFDFLRIARLAFDATKKRHLGVPVDVIGELGVVVRNHLGA